MTSHKHDHDHHDHDHHHNHHGHHHHAHGVSERIGLAFFLNLAFAVVEIVGGIYSNSVAIQSNAIHDLGDAFAIGLNLFFERKAKSSPKDPFSYGLSRLRVLGALATGIILVIGSVIVLARAFPRFWDPPEIHSIAMMWLSGLGITVNAWAAFKMAQGRSLAERMIQLHLLEDVFGWVIVLVGAICIHYWHLVWMDPLLSAALSCWILINVFKNLNAALKVLLQASSDHFTSERLAGKIKELSKVLGVHHVHVWSLDGELHIASAHVVIDGAMSWSNIESLKQEIRKCATQLGPSEITIEFESQESGCLDPEHKV